MKTTPSIDNQVLNYLSLIASMRSVQAGWAYSSLESLLLDKGSTYIPAALPVNVEKGRQKECYKNAALLAFERKDLRYCEGYAAGIIPVMHAWCIDANNIVIDPTWPDAEKCIYHGVAFKTDWACKFMLKNKFYGIFGGEFNRAHSLLQDIKKLNKALDGSFLAFSRPLAPVL